MRSFYISKYSMWECSTKNKLICNDSEKLVILLPGMGYNLDRSFMDYSKQLALDLKLDYLGIEYGFQVSREEFDRNDEDQVRELVLENLDIILSAMDLKGSEGYKEVIFIGKSLGTVLQNTLGKRLKEKRDIEIRDVYLTPVNKTVELGMRENSLVITGTRDELISKENMDKIKDMESAKIIEIEGAGHSLCIKGDVVKSIKALENSISEIKEFLK